jgi:hypothetical protein
MFSPLHPAAYRAGTLCARGESFVSSSFAGFYLLSWAFNFYIILHIIEHSQQAFRFLGGAKKRGGLVTNRTNRYEKKHYHKKFVWLEKGPFVIRSKSFAVFGGNTCFPVEIMRYGKIHTENKSFRKIGFHKLDKND